MAGKPLNYDATPEAMERFMRFVEFDPFGGCWLWSGCLRTYGRFGLHRRAVQAHRVAYHNLVAKVPDHLEMDHLCRNKVCVNPQHLEPVTRKVNMERRAPFDRKKPVCRRGHAYTPENTGQCAAGRYCKACRRNATQAYYYRDHEESKRKLREHMRAWKAKNREASKSH